MQVSVKKKYHPLFSPVCDVSRSVDGFKNIIIRARLQISTYLILGKSVIQN